MVKIRKVLLFVICSFFTIFLSIGYAAISKDFTVSGSIVLTPQEGVFITYASVYSGNATVNSYSGTVLNSKVDLGSSSGTSTATIDITVFNNYDETYAFNGYIYTYGANTFSNENYEISVDIPRKTEVLSKATLSFSVIFSYKNNIVPSVTELISLIDFEFLPPDQIVGDEEDGSEGDAALGGALNRFKEVLNNSTDLNSLVSQMGFFGDFVGNVGGADPEDLSFLNEMFAGDLSMVINGTPQEVTILIKRKNVDGNDSTGLSGLLYRGNEMTIYLTTNKLDSANSMAVTYAAVYTRVSNNTEWYQLGPTYVGEAPVTDYRTGQVGGTGSFNTDYWKTIAVEGKYEAGLSIQEVVALGITS